MDLEKKTTTDYSPDDGKYHARRFSAETTDTATEKYRARRLSAEATDVADARPKTLESYRAYVENAIDKKEYQHWTSEDQREQNRKAIVDYDQKKRTADRTALITQKEFLGRYSDCFDSDNIRRMSSELGSNKLEIYSTENFYDRLPEDSKGVAVIGFREFPSGKVCIKDTENAEMLKHTVTHETIHDLSFQAEKHDAIIQGPEGSETVKHVRKLQSGIDIATTIERIGPEGRDIEYFRKNRGINEGLTELYTVEAMQERGEDPGFFSYPVERGWAIAIHEKMGDDIVAHAYFGGDVESLERRFNSMTDIPNAWEQFNENVDGYLLFESNPELQARNPDQMQRYYDTAWEIIDSLHDDYAGVARKRVI